MKFLCVPCDTPMKLQNVGPPERGSLSVVYSCPECGYEMAMLTNSYETQVVQSLGVRIGPQVEAGELDQRHRLEDGRRVFAEESRVCGGAGAPAGAAHALQERADRVGRLGLQHEVEVAHVDTELDPYNIKRGFWWAHFEWIILAPVPPIVLPARLHDNPVVEWQEKNYYIVSTIINLLIPIALAVAVGAPWWGGVLVSALRLVFSSHVVYSVNSVCHKWGTRPFSTENSARDVWWFPFALGEQYHNYHHAFPRDYRHGVRRFDFDPTKWLIDGLVAIGLARNLFKMPDRRIEDAKRTSVPAE